VIDIQGEVQHFDTYSTSVYDGRRHLRGYLIVLHDITELRKAGEALQRTKDELEILVEHRTGELVNANQRLQCELAERQRQSQKLEAVGQLAGGVAHDFNNMLTVILGFADLASAGLTAQDPLNQFISEIKKAAEQSEYVTRKLLAFSRRQILEPRIVNLNQLILEMDGMLRRLINEDIELITILHPDLSLVKVDPGQLEQVVVNLVLNARDAMPTGGKVTIETRNFTLDKEHAVSYPDLCAGEYVVLTVSDNGMGIDPEVKGVHYLILTGETRPDPSWLSAYSVQRPD
jgi:signal transduction histidine kinase